MAPNGADYFNLILTPTYNVNTGLPLIQVLARNLVVTNTYRGDDRLATLVTPTHGTPGAYFTRVKAMKVTTEVARQNLSKEVDIVVHRSVAVLDKGSNHILTPNQPKPIEFHHSYCKVS